MAIYFPDGTRAYSETTTALDDIAEMSFFISFQMPNLEENARQYIWSFDDNSSGQQISFRTDKDPNNKKLRWSFTAGDGSGGTAGANAIAGTALSEDTTYQIAGRYRFDNAAGLELLQDGVQIAVGSTESHGSEFSSSNHRMIINSQTVGGSQEAGVKIENFMLWRDKYLSEEECLALRDNGYWWLCMTEEPTFWNYMDCLPSSGPILDRSSNERNLTEIVGTLEDVTPVPMTGVSYMTPNPASGVVLGLNSSFVPPDPPAEYEFVAYVDNVHGQKPRYDIDGLVNGTSYETIVVAEDKSGNVSGSTVPVTGTPSAPEFVLAEAVPWRTSRFFTKYKYTQQDFSTSRTS